MRFLKETLAAPFPPVAETSTTLSIRLWILYPMALASLGAVWGSVTTVLAARQLANMVSDEDASTLALGGVMSIGALVAMVAQPVLGRLYDKTPASLLGRTNTWVFLGGLCAALALLAMAISTDQVMLGTFYAVAAIPLSGMQVALAAVLPERIPLHRRGVMSALAGASTVGGSLFGTVIGGLTATTLDGYAILGTMLLITGSTFAVWARDPASTQGHPLASSPVAENQTRSPKDRLERAYWLTFLSRFMLVLSYFFISGFGLYLLRDYISVGDGSIQDASEALVAASTLGTAALLVFSTVAGLLADRFGFVRLLIVAGSGLFVPAGLLLIHFPNLPAFVVAQILIGAGFGLCGTAHQVAVTQVLPERANTGRDLGIMGIANAGPQILALSIGGMIITGTQNYAILFFLSIVCALLAGAGITFIRMPKAAAKSAAT